MSKISPHLWYTDKADEAAAFRGTRLSSADAPTSAAKTIIVSPGLAHTA
jgi:hypothetical protein